MDEKHPFKNTIFSQCVMEKPMESVFRVLGREETERVNMVREESMAL